jgi:hypothetical protein
VQANEQNGDDATTISQRDEDPDDSEESTAVDASTCAAYIRMARSVGKFSIHLMDEAQPI